ncbi:MAG: dipeptidase, partial [Prolixibacteraceae bacterium]
MIKKATLALLVIMASLMLNVRISGGCTNFLISRGASADGSVMITYAADSHTLYGELYFWPSQDWPAGSFLDVYEWDTGKFLGKIEQVPHTYSVVG